MRQPPFAPTARRISVLIPITSLALALFAAVVHAGGPDGERIIGVYIVSQEAGSDKVADDGPKRAKSDVGVVLYAVLATIDGGKRQFYSDAGPVRVRGRKRSTLPLDHAPRAALRWYKVEPASDNMSNEASGSFQFEQIEYREAAVARWNDKTSVQADVKPTLTPYRGGESGPGIGTMRFKLAARTARGTVSSAGAEARAGRGSGGLSDRVHRVSLRRDDTYLGFMTEMYGQPYIWASAGTSDNKHQSERLEGSDCADLMVYGIRRLGHSVPYTWTGGLHQHTRRLARGSLRRDGVYIDGNGKPIRFTRVGDMILFPRHVGALAEDRGVPGVLDTADIMMHTLFASPREQAIADSGYADNAIEILRWQGLRD